MRARTRADLIGLLADLPDGEIIAPDTDNRSPRRQRRLQRELLKLQLERERLLLKHEKREHRRREREYRWYAARQLPVLVLVVAITVVAGRVLRDIYSIWLVIAVVAVLWLRHAQSSRGRSDEHE